MWSHVFFSIFKFPITHLILPVPFSHGKGLYDALPEDMKYPPFWAKDMKHNNIGKKTFHDLLSLQILLKI